MSAAVIMLHGSGDSGAGIESWLEFASDGTFILGMHRANIKMIYPDAPSIPYTLAGGHHQAVWFDRKQMSYEAPEDPVGIARSLEQVDTLIDGLVQEGISPQRICVAGMSMGGCLALHVAYGNGRWSGKLGACAMMSSFLAEDSALDEAASQRFVSPAGGNSTPALFMATGGADAMVKVTWVERTRIRLEAAGILVPPQVSVFPGLGHDLCRPEIDELSNFIVSTLTSEEG